MNGTPEDETLADEHNLYPIHLAPPKLRAHIRFEADIPLMIPLHESSKVNLKLETEPGVQVGYDVYGEDSAPEKIVFVMGFATGRHGWSLLVNDIFRADPLQYQVIIIDNRGMGTSSAPPIR